MRNTRPTNFPQLRNIPILKFFSVRPYPTCGARQEIDKCTKERERWQKEACGERARASKDGCGKRGYARKEESGVEWLGRVSEGLYTGCQRRNGNALKHTSVRVGVCQCDVHENQETEQRTFHHVLNMNPPIYDTLDMCPCAGIVPTQLPPNVPDLKFEGGWCVEENKLWSCFWVYGKLFNGGDISSKTGMETGVYLIRQGNCENSWLFNVVDFRGFTFTGGRNIQSTFRVRVGLDENSSGRSRRCKVCGAGRTKLAYWSSKQHTKQRKRIHLQLAFGASWSCGESVCLCHLPFKFLVCFSFSSLFPPLPTSQANCLRTQQTRRFSIVLCQRDQHITLGKKLGTVKHPIQTQT